MALYMLMAKYTPEAIKTIVEGDTDRASGFTSGMRSCGWKNAWVLRLNWARVPCRDHRRDARCFGVHGNPAYCDYGRCD